MLTGATLPRWVFPGPLRYSVSMYSNCIFCHANLGANEAIDECERAFRATALRFSTDNIGIARLKEGTELVRVGRPRR